MQAEAPMRLVLSAGEASGDQIGADLALALQEIHPDIELAGLAGPAMQQAGVKAWYGMDQLNLMGLSEVISHLPRLMRLRHQFHDRILDWQPRAFIGIDAPDFNLGLARKVRRQDLMAIHYVSPSVWAWRAHRIRKIAAGLDLLLTLFPFEPALYRPHGLDARFVGHHLADTLSRPADRSTVRRDLGLPETGPVVALLPGSRKGEIDRHAHVLGQTAMQLRQLCPEVCLIALLADASHEERLRAACGPQLDQARVHFLHGQTRPGLRAADVAVAASGTVTLEAFLLGCPLVVFYRLAPTTYWLARGLRLVKSAHVSLPNILSGNALVPERLQHQATPENLVADVRAWLEAPERVEAYRVASRRCRAELATDAGPCAARIIMEKIQS
jgi:lipid-A-disaccharide synthase